MPYLVPRFILDKYAENEFSGQFDAVSLFVDLSGFSTVTTTLMQHGNEASESMSDIMSAIFEPLVSAVYTQGGFITTFAGDAFTALFPTDNLQSKDAYLHALAAAMTIQDYMRKNPTQNTIYATFPFSVKLGIASGSVGWGILTPDSGLDVKAAYYFNGQAVDEAARAEHYAESGNLVVTASVYKIMAGEVQAISAGDAGHQRILSIQSNLPTPQPLPELLDAPQDHFIPSAILERKTHGEFRQVISVFVNLMGIDTAYQLEDFVRSVFSLQAQYGGFLARVDFGDKGCNLLMFWGMPTSHENDISRALNFLLDLPNITPGTFKAGVTYQTLFACFAGSGLRSEFTTYGGGVALAARLMVKAPWGDVWLDETLQQRAQRHFELEKAGDYPFKGFAEPQPVYRLIEAKQQGLDEFFQGEMVGREAELQQIRNFIEPIFLPADTEDSRFAGMCIVAGEAGLGKSRLVYEFQQRLNAELAETGRTVKWLFGQTNQLIKEPLSPFKYSLMNDFNQVATASETRNKRAFSRRMDEIVALMPSEYSNELNRLRSFIGSLLDLYWENSLYATADPEARQEMLFTALKTLMQGMSLLEPTVIITEDLHWIDAETREFAKRLFRNMHGYPIVMVGTVRLDELEETIMMPDVRFDLINLEHLSEASMEQLAEAILGYPISSAVLKLLMERAEGNPFFAEQILLYLRQQGEIELKNNIWFLSNTTQQGSLPGDLRAIFIARLDQLTQEVKDVVQAASILGREFEVRILASMLKDDTDLDEKVLLAEQETVWSALNQVRYLFKHALLRDAAYSMQLRARRRVLHQLAAETLETLYAGNLAIHYRDIAYHYETAYLQGVLEVAPKVFDYLFKAGEQALDNYQHEIAADFFSRCLEITPALDNQKRYSTLLARVDAYFDIQKWNLVESDLAELANLAEKTQIPQQKAGIALKQSRLAHMQAQREDAIYHAEQAIKLAQAAQAVDIETQAQVQLAEIYSDFSDKDAFAYHTQQALNLARAINDRDTEAEALIHLSNITLRHNLDQSTALIHLRQALALFRETGNRRKEAATLYKLTGFSGSNPEDMELTQEALAISREIGDRILEALGLKELASLAFRHHQFNESLQYYFDALNLYREISYERNEADILFNIGSFHRELGELDEAERYYKAGLIKAKNLSILDVGKLSQLSAYYFERELFDDARSYMEQALTKAQESGSPSLQYVAFGEAVSLFARLGDNDEAQPYYDHMIEIEANIDTTEDTLGEDISAMIQSMLLGFLMQEDKHTEALIRAERIWSIIQGETWRDMRERHNISMVFYYELYSVWEADGNRRAYECLEEGYNSLQYITEHLDTDEQRRKFFENVYYNRQTIRAYQEYKGIAPEIGEEQIVPDLGAVLDLPHPDGIPSDEDFARDDDLEVVIGEVEDERPQRQQETISVTADDETPVIIHIEADTAPTVHTSIVREEHHEQAVDGQSDQPKQRPIIHVNITIENHGTIHNFNIYNGDK